MNEKSLPPLDENSAEALRLFRKLDTERKQIIINAIGLLVRYPEFGEAVRAATPEGEGSPPWEVTKRLVAEWMAKEEPV